MASDSTSAQHGSDSTESVSRYSLLCSSGMRWPPPSGARVVNRQLLIPTALVAFAGVVSAVGVGSHAGQTVVVVGDSLTAQAEAPIGLVLTADGWGAGVDGRSGASVTDRHAVGDWPARITAPAAMPPSGVVDRPRS